MKEADPEYEEKLKKLKEMQKSTEKKLRQLQENVKKASATASEKLSAATQTISGSKTETTEKEKKEKKVEKKVVKQEEPEEEEEPEEKPPSRFAQKRAELADRFRQTKVGAAWMVAEREYDYATEFVYKFTGAPRHRKRDAQDLKELQKRLRKSGTNTNSARTQQRARATPQEMTVCTFNQHDSTSSNTLQGASCL